MAIGEESLIANLCFMAWPWKVMSLDCTSWPLTMLQGRHSICRRHVWKSKNHKRCHFWSHNKFPFHRRIRTSFRTRIQQNSSTSRSPKTQWRRCSTTTTALTTNRQESNRLFTWAGWHDPRSWTTGCFHTSCTWWIQRHRQQIWRTR